MVTFILLDSLIKMLYYMCDKSGRPPTSRQLEHAIRRNFGGLESDDWSPFQEFARLIPMDQEIPEVPEEVSPLSIAQWAIIIRVTVLSEPSVVYNASCWIFTYVPETRRSGF